VTIRTAAGRSSQHSDSARCSDLLDEIIDTGKCEAERSFVDEAPAVHPLMHAANHDLGSKGRASRWRYKRFVHFCCARTLED
jgi:hypothetical protein